MDTRNRFCLLTRRHFLRTSLIGSAMAGIGGFAAFGSGGKAATALHIPLALPSLPYPGNALEPYMTPTTLSFHHDKHHKTYVEKTQALIKDTDLKDMSLEEIVCMSADKEDMKAIFNNSAQVWNHSFFWRCMKPKGGGEPTGKMAEKIEDDFGSFAKFKKDFSDAAVNQFGSGWAWLVMDGGKLKAMSTSNAQNPMVMGLTPILVLDVWEHAYYLDYQNRRADYVTAWLDHLVNWDFAMENMGA